MQVTCYCNNILTHCTVLCCACAAGRLSDQYDTIKAKIKAVTITNMAPKSHDGTPAWCVIDDIATPELLNLIKTTAQPASALRHHLMRLKTSFAPKQIKSGPVKGESDAHMQCCLLTILSSQTVWSGCGDAGWLGCARDLSCAHMHRLTRCALLCVLRPAGRSTSVPGWCIISNIATPETLALITTTTPPTSALRSCVQRLKARSTPKPKSASNPAAKASASVPAWCVITDLATPDLLAAITTTKAQPTAAVAVAALRRCVQQLKARCVSVRC